MPPYLPWPVALVYISGACEIAGGLGVLAPRWRQAAGWGLVLLIFAVYPANIHMALHPEIYAAHGIPLWALYARLPLQFVLAAWAYWATRADYSASATH